MPAWIVLPLLAATPCDGTVRGRVVDETTGEGLNQVALTLRSGGTERRGTSGDDGTYVLGGVCPGAATVLAERPDYELDRSRFTAPAPGEINILLQPRDVDVLDDVVVVAPAPRPLDAAAASTLAGQALEDVRGQSLAEALSGLAGVEVLRGSAGGFGKPIIRGQVGRRNLILYDRVRHEGQKWGLEHAPEVDPFAADSLVVLKGAGGIRYGPDAIGGVVLIDPPPLPSQQGISGELHLVGSSNALRGTAAARLQGAHAFAPGFAWRLEGNISRGAAAMTPDYPLDNTGFRVWNASGTAGYARRGFSLRATYRHHNLEAGIFTGLQTENVAQFEESLELDRPVAADLYERDYEIERAKQQVQHHLVLVRSTAALGKAGELVATYALQANARDEFDIVRENISGPQVEFDLRTHSADLVFEQAPVGFRENLALEGAFGASFASRDNRYDGSDPGFLPNYTEIAGGVFALQRMSWERVEVEGGIRYDAMRRASVLDDRAFLAFEAQERVPEDCTDVEETATCTTPFHAASGSLSVAVRPLAQQPAFVTALDLSTAVRFPSTDEQFIKGSVPSFPVFSNGQGTLGLERTWSAGLNLRYAAPWMFVEAAGFGSFIDDYIYFRAEPQQGDDPTAPDYSECAPLQCGVQGPFPLFSPAPVDAVFYGGEIQGTVRPPSWPVSLASRASWVRAQQVPGGEALVFIPPNRYSLRLNYYWPDLGPTRNGRVGVTGTFVQRQRHYDEGADFAPPPPAYALLGAEAGLDLPLGDQRLAFALTGRNLTNARYRDYTSLLRYFANEPGWDVMLRISLLFGGAPAQVPTAAPQRAQLGRRRP